MQKRQIRASVSQGGASRHVVVYQAYNAAIAHAAARADSFLAPLQQGLWRANRMTWVKPSAVWMGYRCGWGLFKDANQSHVLALHIPEDKFFALLSLARLSDCGSGAAAQSDVVVQWDPERLFAPGAAERTGAAGCNSAQPPNKHAYTQMDQDVRSIQIGLRNSAVEMLLDPAVVVQINDVTERFHACGRALADGDLNAAKDALNVNEVPLLVVPSIRARLGMDEQREDEQRDEQRTAAPASGLHRFVVSKELHNSMKRVRPAAYGRSFSSNIVDQNATMISDAVPVTRSFSLVANGIRGGDSRTFPITNVAIADIDTVSAALALGNAALLSFANAETPGGYYTCGGRAQEEDVCRVCPALYPSLLADGLYPIHPSTCLVTPDVEVLRVPGSYAVNGGSLGTVTVLTAAMPKCDGRRPKGGWLSEHSDWAVDVRLRVRTVLGAAASTGKPNLVLGAWGCGAFGNNPHAVAQIFKDQLLSEEFRGKFANVVFAIIDPMGTGNLKPFRRVFSSRNKKKK